MPAALSIETPVVSVEPGGQATAEVRIRNTGTVVDQFACNLVGDASAWAVCEPPGISLFPGAEGTITVRFSPPRSSAVTAGTVPFGVRVTSQEDPDFSVVEEGTVQIGGFAAVQARVVPRTSEGKRRAVHRVEVTNTGNSPVTADLSATDPDELLVFELEPETLTVAPGATETARLKVASRKGPTRGGRRMPFSVLVDRGGVPVQAEATFQQKAKGGSALILVAIVIVAAVLIFLLKDQASSLPLY